MNKRTLGYILLAIALVGLVAVVAINSAKTDVGNTLQHQDEPKTVDLTLLQKSDKQIVTTEHGVSIDATYPVFENVPSVINADIKDFIDQGISDIKDAGVDQSGGEGQETLSFAADYKADQANTHYVSLAFTVNVYSGGAHPNSYYKAFNFDTETGKTVTLAELYPNEKDPLAKLEPAIATALQKYLTDFFASQGDTTTDPDSVLFANVEDFDPQIFENFTFTDQTLTFYFSPYDIASYAVGPIEITIKR